MRFFFTSIQVISSLNSTYILWYPKGENQLPLPPNVQPGCTRNFSGHAVSATTHVGWGLLWPEQHLMVAHGELVQCNAFPPLFIP